MLASLRRHDHVRVIRILVASKLIFRVRHLRPDRNIDFLQSNYNFSHVSPSANNLSIRVKDQHQPFPQHRPHRIRFWVLLTRGEPRNFPHLLVFYQGRRHSSRISGARKNGNLGKRCRGMDHLFTLFH